MNKTIKNNGVLFGLILASWYSISTLVIFFFYQELFVNVYMGFSNTLVSLSVATISLLVAKRKLGGLITFKDAFTSYLIPIVMGLATLIIVSMILFNFVDPSMKEVFTNMSIAFTEKNMGGLDVAPEAIESTIEQIKNSDNFSIGNQFKAFAWKTLLYSIGGMLIALILRNQSEFSTVPTQNQ